MAFTETSNPPAPHYQTGFTNNKVAGVYNQDTPVWKNYEKIIFRVFFIFFVILTVPFDLPRFVKRWIKLLDFDNLHIRDLGGLGASGVSFLRIKSESGEFGIASYASWGIAFLIAIAGAVIWTLADKRSKNYRVLFYFITVAVSFSMIMSLQGLTFSKVFPTQMPALAVTQLNTNYGNFTPQKLYWLQLSFTPVYQVFLGVAELAIMLLLFFRQTRALGAALALAMIGNIAISNHVYDGGIHMAASFFAIGGAFVLWPYLPNIYRLLVQKKDVQPTFYRYPYNKKWEKYLRIVFKSMIFLVFFLLSAWLHYQNYKYDSYKVPARQGLRAARGLYNVTEFRLNNRLIPYSPVDSVRWQEVSFEQWSTLSYRVFQTFMIHGEAGRGKQALDIDRTYESAGTGGGHRHYYYEADTVKQLLHLRNKNKAYRNENFTLHYERSGNSRIILSGINENKDSIYLVLDKEDKNYPLYNQHPNK